jgi:hypothetical protein
LALVIVLPLLISAGGGPAENGDVTIETLNATIESRVGQRLRVVFAKEEQPTLLFRSAQGAWNWSATSKLFIPVENLGDEPLTLALRIEGAPGQSLRGSVAIAPHSADGVAKILMLPLLYRVTS